MKKEVQTLTDLDVFDKISYNEIPKGWQTVSSQIIVKRKLHNRPKNWTQHI